MPIPYVIAYGGADQGAVLRADEPRRDGRAVRDVRRDDYLAAQDALMERGYEARYTDDPSPSCATAS